MENNLERFSQHEVRFMLRTLGLSGAVGCCRGERSTLTNNAFELYFFNVVHD